MNQPKIKPAAVVVNDDPIQLNVLAGLLDMAGIEARAFESAETALATLDPGDPPDLIVSDLYMPGIDGWRFCRLLRSPEYTAFNKIPILVVSATFADHLERITDDLGVEAFLPVPVDREEFAALVWALLEGKQVRRLPRVLIVEDNSTRADLLQKHFAARGYRADTALTAREAEAAFAKTPYDIAVLGYRLPDGTGDALLDTFQTARPDCVCLMTATDPTPVLALSWMKRGAAAYLREPFEPEFLIELCARARRERALLHAEDVLEARTRDLRKSEAFYHTLFESVNDAVLVHEIDLDGMPGKFIAANRIALERLGYTREDLLKLTPRDIAPEDAFKDLAKARANIASTGTSLFETVHLSSDGRRIPVESHVRFLELDGQRVAVSVVRDLSERKRAEEALARSENLYRSVFENIQDVYYRSDRIGNLIMVSPSGAALLGYDTVDEMLGKSIADNIYFNPEDRAVFLAELQKTGVVSNYESRLKRKDGTLVFVETTSHYYYDEAGTIAGVEGILRDITDRKRAEAEREKLQIQLAQAQKMESVGQLAGGVAHDFNNMLQAILSHVSLAMLDIPAGSPLRENLLEIEMCAMRSADLTRQLLAFARK